MALQSLGPESTCEELKDLTLAGDYAAGTTCRGAYAIVVRYPVQLAAMTNLTSAINNWGRNAIVSRLDSNKSTMQSLPSQEQAAPAEGKSSSLAALGLPRLNIPGGPKLKVARLSRLFRGASQDVCRRNCSDSRCAESLLGEMAEA